MRGEIRFGDQRIDTLPAHRRNIGMVFQNYAIFPNLTVGGNVAYGLKARGMCRGARSTQRVARRAGAGPARGLRRALAAPALGRPAAARRDRPRAGDRARRCCCSTSRSPISMRSCGSSMRGEIRELQKSLGITAIYVTHDQEEALAVSDRIAVMRAGRSSRSARRCESIASRRRASSPSSWARPICSTGMVAGLAGPRHARARSAPATSRAEGRRGRGRGRHLLLRPEALRGSPVATPRRRGFARCRRTSRLEFLGALTRFEARRRHAAAASRSSTSRSHAARRAAPSYAGLRPGARDRLRP